MRGLEIVPVVLEPGTALVAEPVLAIAPAAVPALGIVPVAAELETDLVAELQAIVLGAAGLELVQVAAELAPGPVVVPEGTKSATVAHRRVLVAVIAAEALVVAAQTMRVPAVPEAVGAWAGAVTAAAAAGIAVAVE